MKEQPVLGILMDTADGAFATDALGRVVAWNSAAERITGRRADDVIGHACWEVVAGRDSFGNLVCFPGCHVKAMAVRGELPSNHDLLVETRDKELTVDVSTTLVRDDEGKVQAIVHTFRDVTEKRQMEAHLRKSLGAHTPPNDEPPESARQLTDREQEVLRLLSAGLSTPAIAERLSIRRATVRNHVQNILKKLAVHSKLEAVVLANRYHLT